MGPTLSHIYRERAEESALQARATPLANVRDRCLRSATAWSAMADRAAESEAKKIENGALKQVLPA